MPRLASPRRQTKLKIEATKVMITVKSHVTRTDAMMMGGDISTISTAAKIVRTVLQNNNRSFPSLEGSLLFGYKEERNVTVKAKMTREVQSCRNLSESIM